ncbi:hypothetical protein PoB_006637200 [Plakobranchus ocellatus]|uniref:Uncharacterized protein n=1 Tax=Plakobranchus ocellatus TaxID=259542 RepID=A0AAV4D6V4_9GAST|nr:hypothetical protein PoB_006637200 [Plakobranchus ocellatus]
MVVVGALYICLWPALGSGPVYPAQSPDEAVCRDYWHYSFFFVNTFVDTGRKEQNGGGHDDDDDDDDRGGGGGEQEEEEEEEIVKNDEKNHYRC